MDGPVSEESQSSVTTPRRKEPVLALFNAIHPTLEFEEQPVTSTSAVCSLGSLTAPKTARILGVHQLFQVFLYGEAFKTETHMRS